MVDNLYYCLSDIRYLINILLSYFLLSVYDGGPHDIMRKYFEQHDQDSKHKQTKQVTRNPGAGVKNTDEMPGTPQSRDTKAVKD